MQYRRRTLALGKGGEFRMRTYRAPVLIAHGAAVSMTLGPSTGMTVESFNHWA
jgi:hypothetical protein